MDSIPKSCAWKSISWKSSIPLVLAFRPRIPWFTQKKREKKLKPKRIRKRGTYDGSGVVQDGSDGPLASFLVAKQRQFRWVNSSNSLFAVTHKYVAKRERERERQTKLGLRRERQRGHRAEPRPGLMVGSWWRFPVLSFSSYTSRVPIFCVLLLRSVSTTRRFRRGID